MIVILHVLIFQFVTPIRTGWFWISFIKFDNVTCLKDCGYILCQCYDLKEDTMHSRLPWSSINGTKI